MISFVVTVPFKNRGKHDSSLWAAVVTALTTSAHDLLKQHEDQGCKVLQFCSYFSLQIVKHVPLAPDPLLHTPTQFYCIDFEKKADPYQMDEEQNLNLKMRQKIQ